MDNLKVGDIVVRNSYGGDIFFRIIDKIEDKGTPTYILKGLLYRLRADSDGSDLVKKDATKANNQMQRELSRIARYAYSRSHSRGLFNLPIFRGRTGKVLHIDGDEDYMNRCLRQYREENVRAVGDFINEDRQPEIIIPLLEKYKPDILVVTGHDAIKKNTSNLQSVSNYRNSQYFIQSVKEARKYEASYDKLCIFAGACQSYYEGIMEAGANFASSPGRILINALDPAIVGQKVASTDNRRIVTPNEVIQLTVSGKEGIGGINTRGHMNM